MVTSDDHDPTDDPPLWGPTDDALPPGFVDDPLDDNLLPPRNRSSADRDWSSRRSPHKLTPGLEPQQMDEPAPATADDADELDLIAPVYRPEPSPVGDPSPPPHVRDNADDDVDFGAGRRGSSAVSIAALLGIAIICVAAVSWFLTRGDDADPTPTDDVAIDESVVEDAANDNASDPQETAEPADATSDDPDPMTPDRVTENTGTLVVELAAPVGPAAALLSTATAGDVVVAIAADVNPDLTDDEPRTRLLRLDGAAWAPIDLDGRSPLSIGHDDTAWIALATDSTGSVDYGSSPDGSTWEWLPVEGAPISNTGVLTAVDGALVHTPISTPTASTSDAAQLLANAGVDLPATAIVDFDTASVTWIDPSTDPRSDPEPTVTAWTSFGVDVPASWFASTEDSPRSVVLITGVDAANVSAQAIADPFGDDAFVTRVEQVDASVVVLHRTVGPGSPVSATTSTDGATWSPAPADLADQLDAVDVGDNTLRLSPMGTLERRATALAGDWQPLGFDELDPTIPAGSLITRLSGSADQALLLVAAPDEGGWVLSSDDGVSWQSNRLSFVPTRAVSAESYAVLFSPTGRADDATSPRTIGPSAVVRPGS